MLGKQTLNTSARQIPPCASGADSSTDGPSQTSSCATEPAVMPQHPHAQTQDDAQSCLRELQHYPAPHSLRLGRAKRPNRPPPDGPLLLPQSVVVYIQGPATLAHCAHCVSQNGHPPGRRVLTTWTAWDMVDSTITKRDGSRRIFFISVTCRITIQNEGQAFDG